MTDFFDNQAELASETDDDDFDEDTGEKTRHARRDDAENIDDSSEEEEDEDEDAEREVRDSACHSEPPELTPHLSGARRLHRRGWGG